MWGSKRPLIIGPWLGEVGPELQYWIPWLQQLKKSGAFSDRRVIAVSRGGVGSWYQYLTEEYVEVFDLVDAAAYKAVRAERTTEKQFSWTTGETKLIKQVADKLDIAKYDTLHPSKMWEAVLVYFEEKKGLAWFLEQLHFAQIIPPTIPNLKLPERYVAVRFYQSDLFPATPDNQQFLADLFQRLTKQHDVVALVTNSQLDDHAQFPMPQHDRVRTVVIDRDLATNLTLQTAVLAGADAFVGTYGGLTILPGLVGKPCFGFIGAPLADQQALHFRHEAVTNYLYQQLAKRPYQVIQLAAWHQLKSLLS
ncbi:MAG: hypothetical protein HY565_05690 [Candidatus Kerfeldbacteria bacterium]|nr:hypothetical protein [Candidatus Kerfeldbacteria bacterium]